jgi:hypothetical protein
MSDEEHTHQYTKVVTSTTGPFPAEGVDANGNPKVTNFYVDYWEEICQCGAKNGTNGNTSREG